MRNRVSISATIYNKRGKVIARGENSYVKTHPRQAQNAKEVGDPHKIYLHAEIDALIACRSGIPYKIKIERYDSVGNPKNAKPCPICELAIKKAGIRFVEYTVG
jgi:tRNA(Arg) A34 adenosine deaminase TadA